jgi:hypothetical protein
MSSSVIDYKSIFLRNSKVKIKGLVSAAKYNGLVGIVTGYKESESGIRIEILLIDKIDGDIKKLDVQPKNLDFYCDGWDRDTQLEYSTYRHELITKIDKELTIDDLIILERIGLDSTFGIVFRALYKDIPVAIKFFKYNPEEVKITQFFGKIPLKKSIDEPFLINFGSGELMVGNNYKLLDEGIVKILIHGSEEAVAIHNKREDKFSKLSEDKLSYLINEMAVMDLNQVRLKTWPNRKSPEEITKFAVKAFPHIFAPDTLVTFKKFCDTLMCRSMGVLRRFHKYKYTHGDPHPGNFMYLKDGTLVIHDYDQSRLINTKNADKDIDKDIENFTAAWDVWGAKESPELASFSASRISKSSNGGTYSRKPKSRKYKKPKVKKIYRKTRR